ncbi:MAG TPA: hypothetical protein VGK59_00880 [Ohtaekwangia sp.]
MSSKRNLVIYALGVVYVIMLVSFAKEEIFYSEDGGVKFMMIKEYVTGDWDSKLELEPPAWAAKLWRDGLYPFRKPFVYDTPEGRISGFPPFFSMITAPFYKMFGFHGLYILPALSVFILWGLFIRLGRNLQVSSQAITLGLIALIFGSSLTVYSGIFWEHTLATLCCFAGLYYLLSTYSQQSGTNVSALLWGVATGFALWLRPESAFILMFFIAWSLHDIFRLKNKQRYFFLTGATVSILGFMVFNYLIYKNPMGLHSQQMTEGLGLVQRVMKGGYILVVLCAKAILYDPISLFVLLIAALNFKSVWAGLKGKPEVTSILLLGILFFYGSSAWIFPNTGGLNWGIRYALVCVPFFYVLGILFLDQFKTISPFARYSALVLSVLIVYGIFQNTYRGAKSLHENYNSPKVGVSDYFMKNTNQVILITKTNHAAEFQGLLKSSTFLLAESREQVDTFLKHPASREYDFSLIFETNDPYGKISLKESDLTDFYAAETIGNFVIYKYKK